jgi:hypothetical protein
VSAGDVVGGQAALLLTSIAHVVLEFEPPCSIRIGTDRVIEEAIDTQRSFWWKSARLGRRAGEDLGDVAE